MRATQLSPVFEHPYGLDNTPTTEYYKAMQARSYRLNAELRAAKEKQGIQYTTKGDFCHLAGKGLSYAKG